MFKVWHVTTVALTMATPSIAKNAEECGKVDDSDTRLACYDQIFRDKDEKSPRVNSTGKWKVHTGQSKIDDTITVISYLSSEDTIPKKYGNQRQSAMLYLRCLENTTSVYFEFGDHFLSDTQGYGDITYRLDADAAATMGFQESTDHSALGLWRGGSAIPFIKNMFDHQQMVVRVTPFNESAITATFDITGAKDAVKLLRTACGW